MPMAIERLSRRALLGAAACAAVPAWSASAPPTTLFAAWDQTGGNDASHRIGLLRLSNSALRVHAALEVPTRAHGLALEPEGTLLAVARRPGDWLVRWQPARGAPHWHWNAGGRSFNGHIERRGDTVFTTETDNESGQGVLVLRDAITLKERAVWPTHGRDPHDFLFTDDGTLWVANGGIGTDTATGRIKDVRAMDSSLVRLDARSGELTGQWRLADARLSLRHLARADDGRVGVALQAEHDEAAQRDAAPLLAVWQDGALCAVSGPPAAGYGGDIAAIGSRFFVSATRAGAVWACDSDGAWRNMAQAREVCALAASPQRLWCGAADGVLTIDDHLSSRLQREPTALHLDNHAIVVAATSRPEPAR
jgi:uncharacterized protein